VLKRAGLPQIRFHDLSIATPPCSCAREFTPRSCRSGWVIARLLLPFRFTVMCYPGCRKKRPELLKLGYSTVMLELVVMT
jgi:hypothetical protein